MSGRRSDSPLVYFVRQVGGGGPVKIGCSQRPADRLISLMCWAPFPLEVVATIPGDEALERRFHAMFAKQHSHREWFRPSTALDAVIAAVAAGSFDTAALPEGVNVTYSRVFSEECRQQMAASMKLGWMVRSGYPVPAEVRQAQYGHFRMTPEERAAQRAVISAFVKAHHPIAKAARQTRRGQA